MSNHYPLQRHANAETQSHGIIARIRAYIRDVRTEMRAVTWPSFHQVYATTAVVLFLVFALALYLLVVDSAVDAVRIPLFQFFTGLQK